MASRRFPPSVAFARVIYRLRDRGGQQWSADKWIVGLLRFSLQT